MNSEKVSDVAFRCGEKHFLLPIFHNAILIDAKRQKHRVGGS